MGGGEAGDGGEFGVVDLFPGLGLLGLVGERGGEGRERDLWLGVEALPLCDEDGQLWVGQFRGWD